MALLLLCFSFSRSPSLALVAAPAASVASRKENCRNTTDSDCRCMILANRIHNALRPLRQRNNCDKLQLVSALLLLHRLDPCQKASALSLRCSNCAPCTASAFRATDSDSCLVSVCTSPRNRAICEYFFLNLASPTHERPFLIPAAVRADRMRGGRNKFGPMYKRDRARKLQIMRQRQLAVQALRAAEGSTSQLSPNGYQQPYSNMNIKQEIQIPQVTLDARKGSRRQTNFGLRSRFRRSPRRRTPRRAR